MSTTHQLANFVPIEDAQQALGGVSRSTIYALIDIGRLQRVHIGRRAFITGGSIAAYIESITSEDRTGGAK